MARLIRRTHRELVHVGLAEHHRARVPEILRHRRFIRRHEILEDPASRCGAHAFGAEQILDAERHAFKWARFAGRESPVGRCGHFVGLLRRFGNECVQ